MIVLFKVYQWKGEASERPLGSRLLIVVELLGKKAVEDIVGQKCFYY